MLGVGRMGTSAKRGRIVLKCARTNREANMDIPEISADGHDTTGDMLRRAMAERGFSKSRLSRESGVSYRTITRIMSGDRIGSLDTWTRVASAMGTTIDGITRNEQG